MDEMQTFFSLESGKIYDVTVEDGNNLNKWEIPVSGYPKSSCKKCFGRGYTGRHAELRYFQICPCLHKKIEYSKLKKDQK